MSRNRLPLLAGCLLAEVIYLASGARPAHMSRAATRAPAPVSASAAIVREPLPIERQLVEIARVQNAAIFAEHACDGIVAGQTIGSISLRLTPATSRRHFDSVTTAALKHRAAGPLWYRAFTDQRFRAALPSRHLEQSYDPSGKQLLRLRVR